MRYLVRRIAASLLVIFGAITLVFVILYWLPGDPAALMAGEDAPAAHIQQMREALGTDRPLIQQYGSYLGRLAHGDLGTSFETGEPVARRLEAQFPASLALVSFAALISMVAGVTASRRPSSAAAGSIMRSRLPCSPSRRCRASGWVSC